MRVELFDSDKKSSHGKGEIADAEIFEQRILQRFGKFYSYDGLQRGILTFVEVIPYNVTEF